MPKIAVQAYSVRDEFAKNQVEALRKLKNLGYEGVEMWGLSANFDPSYTRGLFAGLGLELVSWHTGWGEYETEEKTDALIDFLKKTGCPCAVVPWMPEMDINQWDEIINKFNAICKKLEQAGLRFGFHSHSGEMKNLPNGKCAWEMIGDGTLDNFVMQIDIGNAASGGQDPYALYEKYAAKGANVHYKAYSQDKKLDCAIGEDDIDWSKIVNISKSSGCEWIIVEKDAQDNFVSVEKSVNYLKTLI